MIENIDEKNNDIETASESFDNSEIECTERKPRSGIVATGRVASDRSRRRSLRRSDVRFRYPVDRSGDNGRRHRPGPVARILWLHRLAATRRRAVGALAHRGRRAPSE